MKKLLLLMLALQLLLLSACSGPAAPPEPTATPDPEAKYKVYTDAKNIHYWEYQLLSDGTAKITDTNIGGFKEALVLPEILEGHTVTALSEMALANNLCSSLTIPNTLTTLEGYPFWNMSSLSQITVAADHPAFAIIDGALYEKATRTLIAYPHELSLVSLTIPEGIQAIGKRAFYEASIEEVILPSSLKTISEAAFARSSLQSIAIPGSVTSIGDHAFEHCRNLKEVTFSEGLTSIGESAFEETSLRAVTLPASMRDIGDAAFKSIPTLYTLDLGGTVNIGASAFYSAALSSLTIPSSVRSIGDDAFAFCAGVGSTHPLSLTIQEGVEHIGDEAFMFARIAEVQLPASVKEIGRGVFCSNADIQISVAPGSTYLAVEDDCLVTTTDHRLLACMIQTDNPTIPACVKIIDPKAFSHTRQRLTRIHIPANVEKLDSYAFDSTNLASITFDEGLKHIGDWAFAGKDLTEIVLPDSLETMDSYIFSGCKELKSVTMPANLTGLSSQFLYPITSRSFSDTQPRNVSFLVEADSLAHKVLQKHIDQGNQWGISIAIKGSLDWLNP